MEIKSRNMWRLFARLCVLILIVLPVLMLSADRAGATADSGTEIYMPLLLTQPACEPNVEEAELAAIFQTDPAQSRERIECDVVLSEVARQRAQDMAARHYFGHVNPDGVGPNLLVRASGYALPDEYSMSQDGNNIESIAGGYESAEAAWSGLMDSPAHRRHLLGEVDFYREQTDLGIGYFFDADSDYQHYWVIITAKPAHE